MATCAAMKLFVLGGSAKMTVLLTLDESDVNFIKLTAVSFSRPA